MGKKCDNSDEEYFFYYKNSSKKIVPNKDKKVNKKAKKRLKEIFDKHSEELPKRYRENFENVKLYNPKNKVDNANALLIDPEEGAYHLKNSLNHLTGKEWIKFTKSWFIFNALSKDLKEEKEICPDSEDHPATFSPTMIESFVKFFTKEGSKVIDPFMGIGSTLVACKRNNREGYGIELNEKYYNIATKRVPEFKDNIINGDSRNIRDYFDEEKFDFSISSPPYWDILNRSTKDFKKKRESSNLDTNYSNDEKDIGNIEKYNKFLKEITDIYLDIYDILKNKSYLVVIVKNIKKEGKVYPLAWDLASNLSKKYDLCDEKIWIQDKIALAPYGYPYAWASNILHHYCIILRKNANDK